MKQEQFEQAHEPQWNAFEAWLAAQGARQRSATPPPFPEAEVPERYRQLCAHLALARSRDYGQALVARLHRLALEGHDLLYGTPGGWLQAFGDYLGGGFARAVRARWRSVLVASLLFYGPYLLLALVVRQWPDFAFVVLPEDMLREFDQMYGPSGEVLGRTRDADDDMTMFGFYIMNNIGIGFQTFAGGLPAGLGTLFATVYNGVFFGVVEAHIVNLGYAERFYSFVSGHSAFELTAIVLCAASGFELGWAVIAPGGLTRGAAVRAAARRVTGIVAGAAAMLLLAAAVEAFWSPRPLEPWVKYGVGLFNWLLVIAYFTLAGRGRAA